MSKLIVLLAALLVIGCLSACHRADAAADTEEEQAANEEPALITFPKIDRHPPLEDYMLGTLGSLPDYDPWSPVNLRIRDVSALDLSESLERLLMADFDDNTAWPPDERMPAGFDRQRIMELGKNPGLGVRTLHARGITGRGVGIAISDQALPTKHQEYVDRLRLYEEIHLQGRDDPSMHGAGVASIAVGKTVGVAPEADLYYIAAWSVDWDSSPEGRTYNYTYKAQAIRRIVEINKQLPDDRKIRVISISKGWGPEQKAYDDIMAACKEAEAAGMLVVCGSTDEVHGPEFLFLGLGRPPLADPDEFEAREPWMHVARGFYNGRESSDWLLIPCDSRTTASHMGNDKYAFYREGGLSWAIPYLAGVYALAAQVDPEITPKRFWALAMKIGRTIDVEHDGRKYRLGRIINPVGIIEALQKD